MKIGILAMGICVAACGDDGGFSGGNENEVITAVVLSFTPSGGGTAVVAEFDDPDGDGGDPPVIDSIDLAAGDFDLSIAFENRLEDPVEDITAEVSDEGDEHQIFLTGTAVDGPASDQPGAPLSQAYADSDGNGNPLGLASSITATAGTGALTITLRHLPPINGEAVKTADLAAAVRSGGVASIGGESDVSVSFDVAVQ